MSYLTNILHCSMKEVRQLLNQQIISPKELCEVCLKRLRATSDLNAFITVTQKQALKQADYQTTDEGSGGALKGIPVAFKDNFCTTDILTSCASRTLHNFHPPYSATVAERMLGQNAVMLGKTNMDAFAMGAGGTDSLYGPVRNPWRYPWSDRSTKHTNKYCDETVSDDMAARETDFHISGGSSGGSAVAVATGCVFAALGSDSAGSTRVPAAFCGIPALKPTYGLVSRHGLVSLVNSMDVPGIMAKTMDDIAGVLNTIGGWDVNDSTTVRDPFTPIDLSRDIDVRNLHVALPKEFRSSAITEDVANLWLSVADMLSNSGAKVTWVSLPHALHSITCYHVVSCCEVASNFARYDGLQYGHRAPNDLSTEEMYAETRHESFNKVVRGRILAGNYFLLKQNYEKYFVHAQKVRRLISDELRGVFEGGVDVLLTPATPGDAPLYSQFMKEDNQQRSHDYDVFAAIVNLAGVPAAVVPCGLSINQLPLALQLVSPPFTEQTLLSLAKFIERTVDFPRLNLDFLDEVAR